MKVNSSFFARMPEMTVSCHWQQSSEHVCNVDETLVDSHVECTFCWCVGRGAVLVMAGTPSVQPDCQCPFPRHQHRQFPVSGSSAEPPTHWRHPLHPSSAVSPDFVPAFTPLVDGSSAGVSVSPDTQSSSRQTHWYVTFRTHWASAASVT